MSGIDLERFRSGYMRNTEALNKRDLDVAFDWVRPDFEWRVLADALPSDIYPVAPPVLRGKEETKAYFDHLTTDWNYRLEPEGFEDPGDGTAVVHALGIIRGRASGLKGEVHFTQIWELDEEGWPKSVRERLDDYSLEGLSGTE